MAFNLNAIKSLFRKLVPYADDVGRAAANYGDDIAKGIANYGDDAARAVANYGDDALRAADKLDDLTPNMRLIRDNYAQLSDPEKKVFDLGLSPGYSRNGRDVVEFVTGDLGIDGKMFHYPASNNTRSLRTKARIMDNISGLTDLEYGLNSNNISPHYVSNSAAHPALNAIALSRGHDPLLTGATSPWLGNAHLSPDGLSFTKAVIDKNRFPSKTIVDDFTDVGNGNYLIERRPHRNTALGRWYAKTMSNPTPYRNGFEDGYPPIPPIPPIYSGGKRNPSYDSLFDEDLPF